MPLTPTMIASPIASPIADLIPHSGQSVLLDALVSVDEESIRCRTEIRPRTWFVEDDEVGSILCLELMAQTIAVFAGVHKAKAGEPITKAFLLSCRELVLDASTLRVGDVLEVDAVLKYDGGSALASFACEVKREGESIARGELNVFQGQLERRGS